MKSIITQGVSLAILLLSSGAALAATNTITPEKALQGTVVSAPTGDNAAFKYLDTNEDGVLTAKELAAAGLGDSLNAMDADRDGLVSKEELIAYTARH